MRTLLIHEPRLAMTGKEHRAEGARIHRLDWTPTGDGTIDERWTTSADAGRSWQIKR